jgi:hypothetical protein
MTILEQNREKIEKIVLTEQEIKEAIFEAKKKKFFHVEHEAYWNEQEKIKSKP